MRSTTATARLAGALFIAATVTSLVATGLLNPIVNGSGYLVHIYANQDRVLVGACFELLAAFTSAGIAMALYPVLRRHGQGLAIGSVGFRLIEGTLYTVGAVGTLLLVTLSQQYAQAGHPRSLYFQTAGELLRELRHWSGLVGAMAFYVGGFMYYCLFYQSRLIPRWLSVWGIIGVGLGFVAGCLVLLDATAYMSSVQVGLNLPIAVNEMVLALWLIAKGFDRSPSVPSVTSSAAMEGASASIP